jgi:large subunit ribosomal protein L13
MRTTIQKTKIDRKVHLIDATDQPLGRLATKIANLLRGKGKVNFTPQIDNGDFAVVSHIDKVSFSGKKMEQKQYYRFSGYPGGLKTTKLSELFAKNPQEVLKKAVYQMLPATKHRKNIIKRLIYK